MIKFYLRRKLSGLHQGGLIEMTNEHTFIGFIGTYTKGDSEGIYSFTFHADTGKIEDIKVAATLDNPTYLAISTHNQFLYSVVQEGTAVVLQRLLLTTQVENFN